MQLHVLYDDGDEEDCKYPDADIEITSGAGLQAAEGGETAKVEVVTSGGGRMPAATSRRRAEVDRAAAVTLAQLFTGAGGAEGSRGSGGAGAGGARGSGGAGRRRGIGSSTLTDRHADSDGEEDWGRIRESRHRIGE